MKNFLKSFGYALTGLKLSFAQRNFKVQLFCALITIGLGLYFQITMTEWCLILFCIGLVLSLEVANTAIEHLVDLVSPDFNETAGKIKDLAAASVLISAILSAIVGIIVFWKYVLLTISG